MIASARDDDDETSALDAAQDGRSAVAIVTSLWEKVEALVQLEMKLAIAEAEDKLGALKRELFTKAVSGAIAFAGVLSLVAAVVAALALAMPVWTAALLTGSTLTLAGWLMSRRPLAEPQHSELTSTSTTKETSHGTV